MDKPSLLAGQPFVAIAGAAWLSLLLAACAPTPAVAPEARPQAPPEFPDADYRQLAAQGQPVFRVEPSRSLVTLVARRAGSLSRIGHDHVIAARDLRGYVAPDVGRADVYVELDQLTVDEPELRAQAKLDTHPTPEDIAGTRRNMLGAFDAARYPFAQVRIRGAAAETGDALLDAAVSVHGATRTYAVPVQIVRSGDEFAATGALTLRQTDFGITPLAVLGGALQVQDAVEVRFSIRARRVR